jgi:23S rRNA pseudouridine1911/1915/1917 synthase
MDKFILHATQEDVGERLDKFCSKQIPNLSRSRIKQLIETGHLAANESTIKDCSHYVKLDIVYTLDIPPPEPTDMLPADIKLDVVYEDEHLLVINKPAGLTVHPGAGHHQDTLANALLAYCGDSLSGIGGVSRPGIVHRLDKDTSGLLLVAKNDLAHQHLSQQIAERSLRRLYLAIVWGVPIPLSGIININIARSNLDRTKMKAVKEGGKSAITHYKVLKQLAGGNASLLECKLETGRTHQIRVHFSHIGHSIIGDQVYGHNQRKTSKIKNTEHRTTINQFKRQALHAKNIRFIHPARNEYLEFNVEPPEDFALLLNSLS